MTSASVPRGHLILGVCLPLAVLMGYFLAAPLDSESLAVTVMVFSVLSIPLLMRWHHPMLILSWNACINPFFLPGRPYLWMLMAMASLFFGVLHRATDPQRRFLRVRSLEMAFLCIIAVVVATAFMTGGVGIRSLGSNQYGGKGYFHIFLAIIGYFAFCGQAVPPGRAGWCVAFFFLSGLTSLISNLAYMAGPKFWFLFKLFPAEYAMTQAVAEYSPMQSAMVRIAGTVWASQAVWCFLLARYGVEGIFDFRRPWRLALFSAAVFGGLLGGFRSSIILFLLVFTFLFFLERLWRTRISLFLLMGGVFVGLGLIFFTDQLPGSAQRALSFLPVKIDTAVRVDAQNSTDWRIEMWKRVWPDVPQYLLKGKGYTLNPQDLHLLEESTRRGFVSSSEAAAFAGNYHNGPLSVLIPFGIWGVVAFGWFFAAGLLVLYRNFRHGEPALHHTNAFLLALFAGNLMFFCIIYGSLYDQLFQFTGLLGMSVSLNGGVRNARSNLADTEDKAAIGTAG